MEEETATLRQDPNVKLHWDSESSYIPEMNKDS